MVKELPDIKTQVSIEDMFYALAYAWVQLFNEQPKKESIVVLLAHGALETGRFKSMHCYNIGNIKGREGDGRDYCFFACNELMPVKQAQALVGRSSKDGGNAIITGIRNDGMAWIWFYPKHYGCRFRAFETLEAGALDYMMMLRNRFKLSWPAVVKGDVAAFCHLLKQQNYYTADESSYTKAVANVYNELIKKEYDMDRIPVMSESDKKKLGDLMTITVSNSVDDYFASDDYKNRNRSF